MNSSNERLRSLKAEKLRRLKNQRIDAEQAPAWFHAGQRKAWRSLALDLVIVAGSQSGKTAFLPYFLLREIQRTEPYFRKMGFGTALFVGPTLKLLKAQAIPAFRRLFEFTLKLGKYIGGNEPQFVFSKEGCKRLFGHCDFEMRVLFCYANDSANLESHVAGCAVWDETGQTVNREESLEALDRRLSIARAQGFGRRCFGSTPYAYNFFHRRVYLPAERGEAGYELVTFSTWMNPLQDEALIRAKRAEMPDWKWLMFYEGRFTRPAGSIYDCWSSSENVVDRSKVFAGSEEPGYPPKAWRVFTGTDFGGTNLATVYLAEELEEVGHNVWGEATGRYILFGHYTPGSPQSVADHRRVVSEKLRRRKPARSYGGSHQESGWREAARLSGWWIQEPPTNNVEAQINAAYKGIKERKLLVCRGLDIIDDIERYSRELDEEGEPTEAILNKSKWHRLDALRYVSCAIFRDKPQRASTGSAYSLAGVAA